MLRLLYIALIIGLPARASGAAYPDSMGRQTRRELVAELARHITEHAFFHGGTAVFRYEARIDTVTGLKLYVGEQVSVLGDRGEPDWYCIDFGRPAQPGDIELGIGRKADFYLATHKRYTQKVISRRNRDPTYRNRVLYITFFTNQRRRTTDYGALFDRLVDLTRQLTGVAPVVHGRKTDLAAGTSVGSARREVATDSYDKP